jgi:predicted RNA binding protein YcfA (HicA-like mRNA interferase family)
LRDREVCAILIAHGFVEVRQRGSHVVMQSRNADGTRTVPVPVHDEICIGT